MRVKMDFASSGFMHNPSAVMSDWRARLSESRTGTVDPEHIPSSRTIRPFLQPALSTRGGGSEGFSSGITDVGCLRGSRCCTIAAL